MLPNEKKFYVRKLELELLDEGLGTFKYNFSWASLSFCLLALSLDVHPSLFIYLNEEK